jgi:3-isopropylmalate dehydrogenase
MFYTEDEIRRILKVGFELAAQRTGKLTSVDKFQILKVSELWREVAREVAAEYPQVELEHVLVDNCAMRLIKRPTDFDVIVTSNLFGDVLSDEAAMLVGSVGMSPSASLAGIPTTGSKLFGLYEPIHGSSPNRANQDMANPVGTILSAAMLLRYSLGLSQEADMVDHAVAAVLEQGYRTYDIMAPGMQKVGTQKMGDLVAEQILN